MFMGLGILLGNNRVRPAFDPLVELSSLVGWFDMSDSSAFVESGGTLVSLTNKKSGTLWRRPTLTGSPLLSFLEVGATGDTITRSAGSWIDDGWTPGDAITITGAVNGANNCVNGIVTGVSATVITLGTTDLVTEANVAGCTALGSLPMPGYSATGFNGFPGMTFSGTQGIISTEAAVLAALQGGTSFYLAIAGKVNTADSSMALFGAGSNANATNANRYFGTNITASGVWISACRSNAGSSVNIESTGGSDTNPNVLEFWCDASGSAVGSIQKNGATADPNAAAQVTGTATPTRVGIGNRPASTPNVLLTGAIGEIIVCSSVPTLAQRNSIRGLLGGKWGVAVA
jgi:hypothetical protein